MRKTIIYYVQQKRIGGYIRCYLDLSQLRLKRLSGVFRLTDKALKRAVKFNNNEQQIIKILI